MTLPEVKDVKDVIEGLLGRDCTLGPGDAVDIKENPGPMVAEYIGPTNALTSVVVCDFGLAAFMGAAIGLVPPGGAEAAMEDGELPTSLQENAAEVLNVLAAPLGTASGVHQRLNKTYGPTDARPADIDGWAVSQGMRRDLQVEVKGYGVGRLSIVSAVTT